MKNNTFFNGIFPGKIAGIPAIFLIFIIFGSIVTAASPDRNIEEIGDPCNGTGDSEHCIPPSNWLNSMTSTVSKEFPAPSPLWSDTIGEYYAHVGMSGNGNFVIAGSDTGTLRMYDRSGKILWTVTNPNTSVYGVAISADGRYIAASFSDPTKPADENEWQVRFFDRSGNLLWTYANESAVFTLAITSGSNPNVAVGGSYVTLLDGTGHLVSSQPSGFSGAVWDVTSSGDGKFIATAVDFGWKTRKGEIVVMDRNGSTVVKFPTAYQAHAVRTDRNGVFFTAIDDYRVYTFFRNGTPAWNFSSSPPFRGLAMTPDGTSIVAASQYFVRFFNKTGSQIWNYQTRGYFYDAGISDDGATVIAVGDDGVYVFERNGDIRWKYPTQDFVADVSVSDNGDYFVAGTSGQVMFFSGQGNATVPEPVQPTGIPSIPTTTDPIPSPQRTQQGPLTLFVPFAAIGASVLLVLFRKQEPS
jgi:WD40 repeat protein